MAQHEHKADPSAQSGRRFAPKFKIVIAVIVLCGLFFGGRYFDVQNILKQFINAIAGMGVAGALIFIAVYAVATVFFIPGSILTLGAGFTYGLAIGFVLVSAGSTLGATCAFLAGRHIARGWVSGKIEGNPKFKAIDDAVAREGWKIVGLTRLSPAFPFNLLNYAFGLTSVSFRDYFLASWIGMAPGTVMYVYIGSVAGSLATLGTGESRRTPAQWALYLIGLGIAVAVAVYVTKIAKKALAKRV